MLHASIRTHFHARVDMQQSWELQTWSVHMLHTFQDSSRMLLPHLRTRQAEGIMGSSVGWTWIQTPACCCCFCCFWLCQKHNGAERHNSLLFTAHSLTYTNINAPFCASCALVFLCWVAKVITPVSSLCLTVEFGGMYHIVSSDRESGSYWSCQQYSNYSSAIFISQNYHGAYCLWDFSASC